MIIMASHDQMVLSSVLSGNIQVVKGFGRILVLQLALPFQVRSPHIYEDLIDSMVIVG